MQTPQAPDAAVAGPAGAAGAAAGAGAGPKLADAIKCGGIRHSLTASRGDGGTTAIVNGTSGQAWTCSMLLSRQI